MIKLNVNGSIKYIIAVEKTKTFFHAKLQTPGGYDGRIFQWRGGEKEMLFVNFQCSEFVCFWSVSREPIKELIYQKENGVTRHLGE